MSVSVNKEIIVIFKPLSPITPEIQQYLDDLVKVLNLDLGVVLKEEPNKAVQLLKIMLDNLSKASKEMQKFV